MKAIIAGTFRQAQEYVKDNKLNRLDYHIISEPYCLKGLRNVEVIKVGTWFERNDIDEIEQELSFLTSAGDLTK